MKNSGMSVKVGVLAAVFMTSFAATAEEKTSWTDLVKLSGDARLRYENLEEEGRAARERMLFRARLGVEAEVNDEVKLHGRLVTGTANPVTDWRTMDNAFDDKNAAIDRAFIDWTPDSALTLRGGKMSQPWIVADDLVMAPEVNPEGVAANVKLDANGTMINLHAGYFIVEERSADKETRLYTGQIALKQPIENDSFQLGATVYAFDNVKGMEILGPDATMARGNTTRMTGDKEYPTLLYAVEYTIYELFARASIDAGVPLKLNAQYMVNDDANEYDTGYLVGLATMVSDAIELGYKYRHIEKDATLGVLAEQTHFRNGTDIEGHIPFVRYTIDKNFDVIVEYAFGERGLENGSEIDMIRVDVLARF